MAAFLWVNEFPDFRADAAGGKRTLVVRLGGAGLPIALAAAARVRASPKTTARVVPAQAWTLASFVLASLELRGLPRPSEPAVIGRSPSDVG